MNKTQTKTKPAIPLVKAAFVLPFRKAMEINGIDANRYFRKFRLPATETFDLESLVPEKPFWYLINQVAIQEMIPDFGMQVAQAVPWYRIDSLQPLLKDKRSLRDLLNTFCELASTQSNVSHFEVREEKDICWFSNQGQLLVGNDIQMELYRVTSMIEIIQLAAGNNWKPLVVHLAMPSNKIVYRNRILEGCKLAFSQQQTAIAFPTGLLNATISTGIVTDSAVLDDLDETARLDHMKDKAELVSALREIFLHYVTEDNLSVEMIAEVAGISTRTLQRMLKQNNISYRELLDEARLSYTVNRLNDPASAISEIAYQLGYNDTAHFSRAFKRWTGKSPSQYRADIHN